MHIERQLREDHINGLEVRSELKQLLTGELQVGPFAEYFSEPSHFYAQGYPDHPGDWKQFADRTLLPLWEHHDKIYAADVHAVQVLTWRLECPDEYKVVASLDAAVFDMIKLHVWEYGGGRDEANQAVRFAEQIALPNLDQLRSILVADIEDCTDEEIASYRATL